LIELRTGWKKEINPGFHYGYVILLISILIVTGAMGFGRFGYTTILPSMKEGLLLNNTQMGNIATGNLIGYALFSLIGGFLAVRFSTRKVVSCSMLLTGLAMFFTGTAGSFVQAVALRFLTGFGSAGCNIPIMGLVSAWFTPRRRGVAAGFVGGGSGAGSLVTGFLVPGVISAWPQNGWRLSWFILGGIVVLLGFLSGVLLRNRPSEKGLMPIGGYPAADFSREPEQSPEISRINWSRVYLSPRLWHLGFVYLLFGFAYIIYATFFSVAMINDKGLTQQQGMIWSLVGVIGIFSGIMWGAVSDLIGRKYAMSMIFALQSVSFFLFAVSHNPGVLYLSAILYGFTGFSMGAVVAAACGDYVGPQLAPAAFGFWYGYSFPCHQPGSLPICGRLPG